MDSDIKNILYNKAEYVDDNYESIQRLKRLLKAVIENELTGKQKEYIKLFYFENKNCVEISQMYSVSTQSVYDCITRGRKKIHSILKYYIIFMK